jgi:hypothetical protein
MAGGLVGLGASAAGLAVLAGADCLCRWLPGSKARRLGYVSGGHVESHAGGQTLLELAPPPGFRSGPAAWLGAPA